MNKDDLPFEPAERISKRATGPSRSERRREALDVLQLAQAMMDAPAGLVAQLDLDEDLADLVAESRRVRQHVARKRQGQFLAKHLRRLDDDALTALREVFEQDRDRGRRDAARLHRLEAWRERLVEDGDEALTALLGRYPDADRTRLRQLLRQARRESDADSPPHAWRELLRMLRELDDASDQDG